MRGTVPDSVNIPFEGAFSAEGQLLPSPSVHVLNTHRLQVKAIVGSREECSVEVSFHHHLQLPHSSSSFIFIIYLFIFNLQCQYYDLCLLVF